MKSERKKQRERYALLFILGMTIGCVLGIFVAQDRRQRLPTENLKATCEKCGHHGYLIWERVSH